MKVLHVLEAIEGGTSRHLIDLVSSASVEHHVVVPARREGARTDPTAHAALRAAGAQLHLLRMQRSVASPVNAIAIVRVRALIRHVRPDIVHGHSSVGGAIARLAAAGSRVPVVWTPNGVNDTLVATSIERALSLLTRAAIAVSPSEGELLRARRLAGAGRIHVIPNAIDETQPSPPFNLRARLGLPESAPLVISVARLVAQKAPMDLVATAAALHRLRPDAHVVLIGDGPLENEVDAAIAAAGLSATFHRLSVETNAAGLLPQADVVLLTSHYEGAPYLPLEAFRACVPVVATACVGTRDEIEDGRTGLLFPVGDALGGALAVARCLGEAELGSSLVAAARHSLTEHYSLQISGITHTALYRDLTAS